MSDETFKGKERALRREFAATTRYLGRHFSRTEAGEAAGAYLESLLSQTERKNTWQMAEAAGRANPYAFQHLLGRSRWSADEVRDDHVRRVMEGLGSRGGVLVVDETGFLKKGKQSAGVGRQYSGTAGRIENCQIGVFLGWKTKKGRTFLDRELYLPKDWCEDKKRRKSAKISEEVAFQTKAQLAMTMIERTICLGIRPAWVTADEVYGHDSKFRLFLEELEQNYVVAVPSNQYITRGFSQLKVSDLLEGLAERSWVKLSAGTGTKGPRFYDWALVAINHPHGPSFTRAVLFRRSLSDPKDIAFYLVFCSYKIRLSEVAAAAGSRWSIEECFESAKGEVGLDQYEVRSYPGWYRHMTLAMTAHALLAICQAKVFPHKKRKPAVTSLKEFKKKRGLSSA